MATANGLFRVKLEMDATGANPKPFTALQDFTPSTTHKYSSESWDIAVHEVTWNVNPTFIENADELRGYSSAPWHDGAGSMAAELTAKARVRPKMLALLMFLATSGAVTSKTGTVSDHLSHPLDATSWESKFSWSTGDVPRTASIQFAPTKGQGFKISGCAISTLAFSFEDSGAMVADMTFRGLYFKKAALSVADGGSGVDDITPVYETDVPLKKSNFTFAGDNIFSADSSKATDISFAIENNVSNFFSFGANSIWPDAIEYEDLWARVSGSVTKRQVLAADYERWTGKGADTHFTECIQGLGDYLTGTSGPKATFAIHLPAAQWMAMNPEAITNKRRIGVTFDWEARTDANGAGNWCDIYVVSTQDPADFIAPGA